MSGFSCDKVRIAWLGPIVLGVAAASLLAACAKPVPPPRAPAPAAAPPPPAPPPMIRTSITVAASPDANPDAAGRPSPIVVRVYQLRGDAAFKGTEFFSLFDDERKALGPDLVNREEYVLMPSDRKTIPVTLAQDTRFVGVIAAFRDIRNSQWRAVTPVARSDMTVVVERARVMLFVLQ